MRQDLEQVALEEKPRTRNAKKPRRIWLDQTGQMSIFVALIFQILFIFFAMVINVGLIVHDKINLQNAVDLGAFYGAQRQAELLDEIAHINYQIRQDYKLLTWRYRVLGTLGRHANYSRIVPVMKPANSPVLPDQPQGYQYANSFISAGQTIANATEPPVVCVANEYWQEFGKGSKKVENYCYQNYGTLTPGIPAGNYISPWLAINASYPSFIKASQNLFAQSCNMAAPLNWAFTVQMLYAYRQAVAIRKMMLWSLRRNLISPQFTDIDNASVEDGIRKTVTKNLTLANANNVEAFETINGFTQGGCDANDGEFMMPEIRIAPLLQFMFTHGAGGVAGCSFDIKFHTQYQDIDAIDAAARKNWDADGILTQNSQGEPEPKNPLHSSLGFEKNPWCMGYVGVKAKTRPRKPFAPFGAPIQLEARAFAQPFGGRIGPWYTNRWPHGAAASDPSEKNRIDKLTTPRLNPAGGPIAYSLANLPNFSRFPGDTLGLESQLAQSGERHIFSKMQTGPKLSLLYYAGFKTIPTTGDPVIWAADVKDNEQLDKTPFAEFRLAELSAIEPDLFDATYYSIDPAYFLNYHQRHMAHPERFQLAPIYGQKTQPISDLGSRLDNPGLNFYQIDQEIDDANKKNGIDPTVLAAMPYPIRDWSHLMTGWAPNQVVKYDFPDSRFGKCEQSAVTTAMIPGKCAVGGRVGYSVRIVSREHLLFDDWKIGGDGEGAGGILNKPPLSF